MNHNTMHYNGMHDARTLLINTIVEKTGGSIAVAIVVQAVARHLTSYKFTQFLFKSIKRLFHRACTDLTLVVKHLNDLTANQIYTAAEAYLRSKRLLSAKRLIVSKDDKQKTCALSTEHVEDIVFDDFQGVRLKWRFVADKNAPTAAALQQPQYGCAPSSLTSKKSDNSYYELTFDKKHKDKVLNSYFPYILSLSKQAVEDVSKKAIKLHTMGPDHYAYRTWNSITLDHPITFDKLAMDDNQKKAIIEDLERFVNRKDFYRRIGKPWKRGYLLYGPPGTGKSSLIAAMANYLKFDIYDMELTDVKRNSDLRKLLLSTSNQSILVVEDIDCSLDLAASRGACIKNPTGGPEQTNPDASVKQLTLSGMLNFMDGLWSCCGDERIIVFTTNRKEKLDAALLRPGRMDVHVHMSYCTPSGFRVLANNYLQLKNHPAFDVVEGLLRKINVTPAELAEQLMKNEDPDIVLEELVGFLHRKHSERSK